MFVSSKMLFNLNNDLSLLTKQATSTINSYTSKLKTIMSYHCAFTDHNQFFEDFITFNTFVVTNRDIS